MSKKIKAKNKHGNHLVRGKSRKRAGNSGTKRLDLKRDTLLFPGVSDYRSKSIFDDPPKGTPRKRPRSLEEQYESLGPLFS